MSAPLEWKLTPTERRIAESAFGACHMHADQETRLIAAVNAVHAYRDTTCPTGEGLAQIAAMLVELGREPVSCCHSGDVIERTIAELAADSEVASQRVMSLEADGIERAVWTTELEMMARDVVLAENAHVTAMNTPREQAAYDAVGAAIDKLRVALKLPGAEL
jgi:hypothetical protein